MAPHGEAGRAGPSAGGSKSQPISNPNHAVTRFVVRFFWRVTLGSDACYRRLRSSPLLRLQVLHHIVIGAEHWPDEVRLSDLQPRLCAWCAARVVRTMMITEWRLHGRAGTA